MLGSDCTNSSLESCSITNTECKDMNQLSADTGSSSKTLIHRISTGLHDLQVRNIQEAVASGADNISIPDVVKNVRPCKGVCSQVDVRHPDIVRSNSVSDESSAVVSPYLEVQCTINARNVTVPATSLNSSRIDDKVAAVDNKGMKGLPQTPDSAHIDNKHQDNMLPGCLAQSETRRQEGQAGRTQATPKFKFKPTTLITQESCNDEAFERPAVSNSTTDAFVSNSNIARGHHSLSERGQRARQRYSSSGYGTGSGGSGHSATKSQDRLSQESEDAKAHFSSVSNTHYQEHKSTVYVQNNLTPARMISARAADGLAFTNNAMPAKHLQHRDLNSAQSMTGLNQFSNHKNKNIVNDSNKTNFSGIRTNGPAGTFQQNEQHEHSPQIANYVRYTDTLGHVSQTILHESNNSYLTARTCSSSFIIDPSESSSVSDAFLLMLQDSCSSDTMPEDSKDLLTPLLEDRPHIVHNRTNNNHPTAEDLKKLPLPEEFRSLLQPSAENSSVMSCYGQPIWKYCLNRLLRTMHCDDPACDDFDCLEVKKTLLDLCNDKNDVSRLTEDQEAFLMHMFVHFEQCSLPTCPFSWCRDKPSKSPETAEEVFRMMKPRVENYIEHNVMGNYSADKYMKLQRDLPFDSMPVRGKDWMGLCMMGCFSKTMLALPLPVQTSDMQYWVIKKIPTFDSTSQWEIHTKLRNFSHDSVARFLWIASLEDDNHLLVCSLFQGYALRECLHTLPSKPLGFGPIVFIMGQLMSAARHLHDDPGIIYLNWTSTSILFTQQRGCCPMVKLSNFSCSALKDNYGEDVGYLKLALPRHVVTPELAKGNEIYPVSDVWGLGCILHELVTGFPVWHEFRHESDEHLKDKMLEKPNSPSVYQEFKPVFDICWERDPQRRKSIQELEDLLASVIVQNNK